MDFNKKYNIETLKVVRIKDTEIDSDILERIDGYGDLWDEENSTTNFYSVVRVFEKILTDKKDDTNESTKLKIENLYNQIKDFDYLKISYPV